ncbi:MAG: glycosyltransferase family 39 protein [Planctomycetes bacterium]|nr:glycosyltransferase family 39 protein [Planctomycetota bacterium]
MSDAPAASPATLEPLPPPAPAAPPTAPRGPSPFLPGLLLLLYATLAVSSMKDKVATYDEGGHLAAGYSYLATGDFRISTAHPPLPLLWAALPLLPLQPRLSTQWEEWRSARQYEFAYRFFYHAGNDADQLLFRGRCMIVLLGTLLAAAVWFVARLLLGPWPALAALALACLSPDLLAHGQLVTTDVPMSLFFFMACAAFRACTRRLTLARALGTGLLAGLTLSVKLTGALLVPVFLLLAALAVADPRPWMVSWLPRRTPVEVPSRRLRALHAAGLFFLCGFVAYVVVWAAYGFRYAASPPPNGAADATLLWKGLDPVDSVLDRGAVAARELKLFPEGYANIFLILLRTGWNRPSFLCGELRRGGFWYYFLVTFALKTPIPVLLLLAGGLAAAGKGWGFRSRWDAAALLVPVLVYGGVCLNARLNIGHRHLLPIYPFLFVAAAAAIGAAWRSGRRALRLGAAGLLLWVLVETLGVYPHFLAYFNPFAGGPDGGWRYLVDSNLDWGQDLKGLRKWLDARSEDPRFAQPVLCYFGFADPDYYGLPRTRLVGATAVKDPSAILPIGPLPPGTIVAVSATHLQRQYYKPGAPAARYLFELFDALRDEQPLDKIGYSIFIYEVPPKR